MASIKVKRKTPNPLSKYPFYTLKKAGQYFFMPGEDPIKVRNASRSFQRYHPDIAAAGHKIIVRTETVEGVAGVGVYRRLISDE